MAGKISQLLDPSRIALHVQSPDRTGALHEVAQLLTGHPAMVDFDGFYAELLARDRLDTTCLGNEIALPHARTEHVEAIVLAVGRSDAGIPFEHGNDHVRLLFMLGTPKTKPGDYLLVVSSLCKLLKDPANRAAMLAAATPDDFIKAVVHAEEKLLAPA
jgi:mannitol/fructose-specific phosphotransferase system IIA component (Ntr-type)